MSARPLSEVEEASLRAAMWTPGEFTVNMPDLAARMWATLDSWKRRALHAERGLARICSCPKGQAGNREATDPECAIHAGAAP